MDLETVRSHFDEEALEYDQSILRLVPHYHEQHEVILQLLPFDTASPLRMLDLGCGTGVLSHVLLRAFPNAQLVSLDLSAKMIETAKRNLAAFGDRLTARQADFGKEEIGSGYDLVVSGLAIHHLDDPGKQDLYRRILRALNPGGMFINREIVLGATPALTRRYEQWWRQFVRANGQTDETWFQKYVAEDLPASVEDQLAWLQRAGFTDVGCHWRYISFAIFGGSKPLP
jgi:tRNA (cmo5U34)-methyltransferase